MRVMVMIKANRESEAGVMPSRELLAAMGKFNEELVQAGVMMAGEGLHPSSRGVRIRFSGKEPIITDGPFAETNTTAPIFVFYFATVSAAGRVVRRDSVGRVRCGVGGDWTTPEFRARPTDAVPAGSATPCGLRAP